MCGRFTLIKPKEIEKRFETENQIPLLEPSYNVAPSFTLPIIARNSPNKAIMAKWGFFLYGNIKSPDPLVL